MEGQEKEVVFRELVAEIPSTTYASFGLYNYPAKFIPQIIAYVIKTYAKPEMSIFDPFGGYGTVGVVSKVYGHDYEMWDLNPMIEILHNVAIMDLPEDITPKEIINAIKKSKSTFTPKWENIDYWFPKEFLTLLSKAWGYYHGTKNKTTKMLLLIPLLKTTRYFSYNDNQRQKLSKSPYSKKRVDKLLKGDYETRFYDMIEDNLTDLIKKLKQYKELKPKKVGFVVKGNTDIIKQNLETKHDILITSPPYLQAQEYIRNSKIDLFWLNFSESEIKALGKKELPYAQVDKIPIHSKTYEEYRAKINEPHMLRVYDNYFYSVLGSLTRLQKNINSRMFLFVGSANMRNQNIPLYKIFTEHFTALGWKHEITLIDKIVAKRLFNYSLNPATKKQDTRMAKEQLVILKRI